MGLEKASFSGLWSRFSIGTTRSLLKYQGPGFSLEGKPWGLSRFTLPRGEGLQTSHSCLLPRLAVLHQNVKLLPVWCPKYQKATWYGGDGTGLGVTQLYKEMQAQSVAGCVTMVRALHFSEPQCPHPCSRDLYRFLYACGEDSFRPSSA